VDSRGCGRGGGGAGGRGSLLPPDPLGRRGSPQDDFGTGRGSIHPRQPGLRDLYLRLDRHAQRRRGGPSQPDEPPARDERLAGDLHRRSLARGVHAVVRHRRHRSLPAAAPWGLRDPGAARDGVRRGAALGADRTLRSDGDAGHAGDLAAPGERRRCGIGTAGGVDRRRGSVAGTGGGSAGEGAGAVEPLWSDRSDGLCDRGPGRYRGRGTGHHRPAGRQHAGSPARPVCRDGAVGSRRRAVHRRRGSRPRLSEPAGADRGALRSRSVGSARLATLPDR